MNIVIYGLDESLVRSVADRYGFTLCATFDEFAGEGRNLLLQPSLKGSEEQLAFFGRMAASDDLVDAVVAAVPCDEEFSTVVHYCSCPGKFFTVNAASEAPETAMPEETTAYELERIIETRLGMLCAHEGI